MNRIIITGFFCILIFSIYSQTQEKFNPGRQLLPIQKNQINYNNSPLQSLPESNCGNSDFSYGDWTNWEGCFGDFVWPCLYPGFQIYYPHPLHKIIPAPGYKDANTCDSLIIVYPGASFVARIGDTIETNGGLKAAELKYQVTVTPDSYLFIYRYAVVLQSGGHDHGVQPDFRIMITDTIGQVIDSACGYYYIDAQKSGPPKPGWHVCTAFWDSVYWKDWTTVGMNLSPYAGQTVKIVFRVRPCAFNAHYGYAYISAYCNKLEIQTAACEGQDSAVLTAPPGFSYLWYAISGDPSVNGSTTPSITVPAVDGSTYQCLLTALNGCKVIITNTLHFTQIHAGYTQNLNCAGRSSMFADTTTINQNNVTAWRWFFGNPETGAADSSHVKNPTHIFSAPGNYIVTLIAYSTEGCSDTVIKQITIDSLPDVSNTNRYKLICNNDSTDIDLTSNVTGTLFTWTAIATSPQITGYSNQSLPVSSLNQQLVNNGNEIDSVIYYITPQNSICIGDSVPLFIAIYPTPELTNPERLKSICDSSFTNVSLLSDFELTKFLWTCTATSPETIGYYDNTTTPSVLINHLLKNTGYSTDTVYYHILPLINTCPGDTTIYKVIVYPSPDLSNQMKTDTVCDSIYTNIVLTSHVAGTLFTWRAFALSPLVTGYSNSSSPGILIDQQLMNSGLVPETVIYRLLPSANDCSGDSVDYTVIVNPGDSVKISISASETSVCEGLPVTFTAVPMHGGNNPVFEWKVNGMDAGTNSLYFILIPTDGDKVNCILTSSNSSCTYNNPAASDSIEITVNAYLTVGISVLPSQNPFCPGNPVTFTATPVNGGTSPFYQWKVNGTNAGTNGPVFTYYPVNGDLVWCILNSSELCTSSNPASSIQYLMEENTSIPAGVSISASPNPFCPGTAVTYTATPVNGGTSPAYQWKVNGVNTGANTPTFSFSPQPDDSIRCVMTSNLSCVSSNPASSNTIIMVSNPVPVVTFTRCFDSITTVNAKPIKLKGGIPLGGTYSGPGVNSVSGIFTPSIAGNGSKSLTYSYTNFFFCSASKTMTIIVQIVPSFTCGSNLTDIREGKIYPTVKIGSQCWMAADLNYGKEISASLYQRDNCIAEKYQFAVGSQQSAVYQWDELMQYQESPGLQGLCPPGWHVPSEAEWNTLFANWTNNAFAGMALKYSGYSGFNALMSGVRHMTVEWNWQDIATFYWSSTPYTVTKAWSHGMNDYDPSVAAYPALRSNAFSVRCLKD